MMELLRTFAQISTPNLDKLKGIDSPGTSTIQAVMTLVFTVTGAAAVIMVIIGGIKYAGSQGDPQGVSKAKNTIIFAVLGLVISIFAVTIVQYVGGKL